MTSAVETVTVAVQDLDAAVRLFADTLGLRREYDHRASVSLLAAWHYPVHADVRLVELSCDGYAFGRLRLAQFEGLAAPAQSSEDSYPRPGVASLDLSAGTHAGKAATSLIAAGFAEVRGSAGEILYRNGQNLTLRLLGSGEAHRPSPPPGRIGEIARITIFCADVAAAERFYRDGLGLMAGPSVPPVFTDRQQSGGGVQLRRLPDAAAPAPIHAPLPGNRPGAAILTLRCSDLDGLDATLRRTDVEIVTRPTHVAVGEGVPARVMLVRGPNQEVLELIERDP